MKLTVKAITRRVNGAIKDFVIVTIGGVAFESACNSKLEAQRLVLYITKEAGMGACGYPK